MEKLADKLLKTILLFLTIILIPTCFASAQTCDIYVATSGTDSSIRGTQSSQNGSCVCPEYTHWSGGSCVANEYEVKYCQVGDGWDASFTLCLNGDCGPGNCEYINNVADDVGFTDNYITSPGIPNSLGWVTLIPDNGRTRPVYTCYGNRFDGVSQYNGYQDTCLSLITHPNCGDYTPYPVSNPVPFYVFPNSGAGRQALYLCSTSDYDGYVDWQSDCHGNGIFADPADPIIGYSSVSPINPLSFGPGDHDFTLVHDGLTRLYRVHVPNSYNGSASFPLVFAFHGAGGNIAISISGFALLTDKSDEAGFIVVYPQGIGPFVAGHGIAGSWNADKCCPIATDNNVDDVGFVERMIEELENNFNIDENRVYATGGSNGGMMCFRLACELSDKIAAVAPCIGHDVLNNCTPVRPISVMHFHGTADSCVPYYGGQSGDCMVGYLDMLGLPPRTWNFISVPDYIDQWGAINSCLTQEITYNNGNTTCVTHRGCESNTEVILCTINGMDHRLPMISDGIDVNDAIWDFFERHPMMPLPVCGNGICERESGETQCNCPEDCLVGDVTGDGFINILDLQACVNHILGTQDWGEAAADVNCDGTVNVLDVQAIVNIILGV